MAEDNVWHAPGWTGSDAQIEGYKVQGNYDYWWLQYNYYGYGQNRGGSSTPKKVDPDLTVYYIKESDLYKLYPYSKTNNKKEWEKERDAGNLYTRLDNVMDVDSENVLKHYKELQEEFSDKSTDDSIDINKWKEEVYYDYYEFLNTLIQSKPIESDLIGNSKEEFIQRLKDTYNNFLASYENLVAFETDEDESTVLDADTLVEYNKLALVLKYPNLTYELANEVQNRNNIYEAYKKVLEKKLKTYQADLDSLNKIATTLTSSTLRASDNSDEEAIRMLNMNRRYKDLGNNSINTNSEVQKLKDAITAAGEIYQGNVDGVEGFKASFLQYYDLDEYTPENIVDVLSDEYNRSELNKVKRILDKYDDEEKDPFDTDEYKEKRDKLIAERDAKTAGYNAQLQKIQETIDTYISYKNNVQAEIDLLQSEIDQYTAEIANAKNKIDAANAELNKYPDNEIESDNLIDYFAQNPDIQKNVNILKTYLNWLNEIEQNIKKDIAASIGKAADSIDNYLEVLKELITKYIHEAFYFFHHYDSLEEDIEEIIENNLEDKNLTLNSFKNILYLGDNLLDENVDENSEDYSTLCKEALEKQLILSSNDSESHTYNFGIYKYENDFYLMGLDKNDSDMYYPIPQWIGADEAESFVEEEILQYAESRGIEGDQSIQSSISIVEPITNGSWVKDPTSSPVYRILPENTLYNEEKEYYNVDQTVYQYIDESTWISDVENKRVMWKTGFKAKIFEISDYTMLYDYLVFNPKLEGRIDNAIENSIIFLPLDPSYPIHPHEMATYYQEIIGNAVYEYGEENLIGSLSRLTILENLYRTSFINYIYAFISQQNFETNDDSYKGYLDLKNKWAENKNELSKWQSQLVSLQQVYESGWSENTKEADQGKKQQLEDLIYLTNQQISYYEQQVRIYERQLDNNYQVQFNTDNLVTEAITATKKEYDINKTNLENEYSMYLGKVNHYLNLLFNDRPQGIPINSSVAHSITDTEYNLGINSAINSYNKYFVQKEEGGQNIDFSALIARIDAFSDNYQKHYNLYELVKPGEEYDDLVYKYYYKVNDSYKPYGDYNTIQWNIDISNEKVYKVNQYLDEFNNIIYTLVPINASYSNEVIYCIKNEKENDYDVIEKESNETQAEYEERWESYKNNNNLYTLTIGENGGILQFLNNLLANSEYVQNIIKIYNDSLALYDSLVQQQLGDNSSYQELIEAKNRYEQQLRDLQEITQYKDAADIDHAQAYLDIMAALAKYLQVLTITYIEAVEKRYSVS